MCVGTTIRGTWTMQCGDHSAAPLCSVGTTVRRHYASDRRRHKQFLKILETNKHIQTRWLHALVVS